jgi:hypothetical protein
MTTRANTGRSGAGVGKQKRASIPKGGAKGSRDNGEPAGQMKQKGLAFSPQAKHEEVAPQPTGERGQVPRHKKP